MTNTKSVKSTFLPSFHLNSAFETLAFPILDLFRAWRLFFGHVSIVKVLLDKGADVKIQNDRSETPLDTVIAAWSEELEGFYRVLGGALKLELDLDKIKSARPQIAEGRKSNRLPRQSVAHGKCRWIYPILEYQDR